MAFSLSNSWPFKRFWLLSRLILARAAADSIKKVAKMVVRSSKKNKVRETKFYFIDFWIIPFTLEFKIFRICLRSPTKAAWEVLGLWKCQEFWRPSSKGWPSSLLKICNLLFLGKSTEKCVFWLMIWINICKS